MFQSMSFVYLCQRKPRHSTAFVYSLYTVTASRCLHRELQHRNPCYGQSKLVKVTLLVRRLTRALPYGFWMRDCGLSARRWSNRMRKSSSALKVAHTAPERRLLTSRHFVGAKTVRDALFLVAFNPRLPSAKGLKIILLSCLPKHYRGYHCS